jgi:hypothetical protein
VVASYGLENKVQPIFFYFTLSGFPLRFWLFVLQTINKVSTFKYPFVGTEKLEAINANFRVAANRYQ